MEAVTPLPWQAALLPSLRLTCMTVHHVVFEGPPVWWQAALLPTLLLALRGSLQAVQLSVLVPMTCCRLLASHAAPASRG